MLVPSTFTGRYKNRMAKTAISTDSMRSRIHATTATRLERGDSAVPESGGTGSDGAGRPMRCATTSRVQGTSRKFAGYLSFLTAMEAFRPALGRYFLPKFGSRLKTASSLQPETLTDVRRGASLL